MKNKLILFLFILFSPTFVSAATFLSDGFDAPGSGTGFSNNWSTGSYAGGTLTVSGAQAFRDIAPSSAIDTATMDFWFFMRYSLSGNTSSWGGVSFYDGATEDLFIGSDSGSTTWEFTTVSTPDVNTSIPIFTGVMTQVLTHITQDRIDMWVAPPDLSSEGALGSPDATYTLDPITTIPEWNRMRIGTGGGVTLTIDYMQAATTFEEATSIPAPSTWLLLLMGFFVPAAAKYFSSRNNPRSLTV